MKFRYFFVLFIILIATGYSNLISGQVRGNVSWRDATKESIGRLVVSFGKSADLNYNDEDTLEFGLTEKRENLQGLEMFKRSFILAKEAADSSLYRMDRIINFVDTAYIRKYKEIENCTNEKSRDSLIQIFTANSKVYTYISINEYLEKIKKIYDRPDINDGVLPGVASGIETSQINFLGKMSGIEIADKRQRLTGSRWMTFVSAKFDFLGYFLDKLNQQQHVDLTDIKLIFEVSFDEVKTTEGKIFSNYRIEKIKQPLTGKGTTWDKYLFSVQPFISGGLGKVSGELPSSKLDKSLQLDKSMIYETGILLERKMKPFRNQFFTLNIATGLTFSFFEVKSSLSNGYIEESLGVKAPPFETSGFLKEYSIKSEFQDVDFKDSQWFLGIPFRLGFGFKLDANNKSRGYFNTTFTYKAPLNSKTHANGTVDQTGKFVYEFTMEGTVRKTEVLIGGEGNPMPEFYGKNDAYASKNIEWKNGIVSQTEIGVNFKLKGNSYLNFGPYFSLGSYQLKNSPIELLAVEGGIVNSPLSAMNKKVSFLGYGITLSTSFDIIKLSGK